MRKILFHHLVIVAAVLFFLFGAGAVGFAGAADTGGNEGAVRYSFAQTYLGAGVTHWAGEAQRSLTIGGTHFWGASDFYVRFPLGALRTDHGAFSPGIETSFLWYPAPLKPYALRPFVGVGWTVSSYEQSGGPVAVRHWFPLRAGIAWNLGEHQLELGYTWLSGKSIQYPMDKGGAFDSTAGEIPRVGIGLSYKFLFDTTLHAAPRYISDREEERRLAEAGALDSWGLLISPSSLFPVGRGGLPDHLDQYPPAFTYEVGLTRYFYGSDLSLQAFCRPASMRQEAYGDAVELSAQSVRFEGLKFLPMDYHGFVPFVGLGLGYDVWSDERSWAGSERIAGWAPSLSFGWDIRPTGKEPFVLRQSMRYTASRMAGAPVDSFDVSFIQLVYYWGR